MPLPTEPEKLTVNVTEGDSVTALLYAAKKGARLGVTLVLGHGAGGNQLSSFMRLMADGFSSRGIDAMTFNFIYSERGRSVPDQTPKLEACWGAVIAAALSNKKLKKNYLVIGGKSMGGRIASHIAAKASANEADEIRGLLFLGYPLHPPGKPDQLRDEHLKNVRAPVLFVQGSRDPFGTAEEIKGTIKKGHLPATVLVIEGGDHSFKVPKSLGMSQPQVHELIMDEVTNWLKREVTK